MQRIQGSHLPPCHRHMVIATNLSSLFDLQHCSIPQTRTECCLEFTAVSGHRMFLGLSGSAQPTPSVPVRRDHSPFPSHRRWLAIKLAPTGSPSIVVYKRTEATAPRQADRGSNPCSMACVRSVFPVCCIG